MIIWSIHFPCVISFSEQLAKVNHTLRRLIISNCQIVRKPLSWFWLGPHQLKFDSPSLSDAASLGTTLHFLQPIAPVLFENWHTPCKSSGKIIGTCKECSSQSLRVNHTKHHVSMNFIHHMILWRVSGWAKPSALRLSWSKLLLHHRWCREIRFLHTKNCFQFPPTFSLNSYLTYHKSGRAEMWPCFIERSSCILPLTVPRAALKEQSVNEKFYFPCLPMLCPITSRCILPSHLLWKAHSFSENCSYAVPPTEWTSPPTVPCLIQNEIYLRYDDNHKIYNRPLRFSSIQERAEGEIWKMVCTCSPGRARRIYPHLYNSLKSRRTMQFSNCS